MSWTNIADILFQAGACVAAACVVYGGWLSITTPEVDPHKALGADRSRDATPEAELLPRRPSGAARREGIRPTRKRAMKVWAGSGVLVLLFLASAGYVVFGGAYAVVSAPQAETSMETVAAELADAGGAMNKEIVSASSEKEKQ